MKKFIVFQITSRRNYDVAEILNANNQLKRLVTDFYSFPNSYFDRIIKLLVPKFHVFFLKYQNKNIPNSLISRNLFSGFCYRFFLKYLKKKNQSLGLRIASFFLKQNTLKINNYNAVYGFDTCSLEMFLNKEMCYLVLEQCVAPRRSQIRMYQTLHKNYNINVNENISNCKKLKKVEESEWKLANKIICPSNYVKNELLKAGIKEDKISVIPYGFSNEVSYDLVKTALSQRTYDEIFNILFVGNEAIRKGVVDIIQIAFQLEENKNIRFHLVGKIKDELVKFGITDYPKNVIFHGKLNKTKLYSLYSKSHLFFLPSYLEGSALVNYEALSFGLPLLTTHEAGSVINNEINGFIVEPGDISSMINRINQVYLNRKLLEEMSLSALEKSTNYTIQKYKDRLLSVINNEYNEN
jgi:glycosyltransferase involved in cell wall biosynthesis